ncbi:hypothetical protein SNK04_008353 [Fusarium graminearum]
MAQNSMYSSGQFTNPGPAPRPPTDRPRLNLTPNANLPGSMANMAISPIRSTATSTYTGSTISLPIARQQSNNTDGLGGVAVKKEGWASVKESKNFIQPWKQKYLILRKESLDFHKTEGGKVSYTLYLRDVVNVGRVEAAGTIFEIKRKPDGSSNSPGDDDGQTKTLQIKVKSDDDLYEWIDFIYGACPGMGGVSNPTNFSHAVHVGFDPKTGEFVGLPPEWSKLLNSSAITKEDYERNPQAVFEVLDFYTDLAKRAENPNQYPSLTPTPPAQGQGNKQLGYGSGNSVAPPRPAPPAPSQRPGYNPSPVQPNPNAPRRPARPDERPTQQDQQQQYQQRQQMQQMAPNYMSQDALREEQRKKQQEAQRQREREMEEQNRRELEAYNASLPKTKVPLAQQEIGGGYSSSSQSDRFNPSRAAPPAPKASQQQSNLRAQRPAPSPPTAASQRPPLASQASSGASQAQRTPRADNGVANAPVMPTEASRHRLDSHSSKRRPLACQRLLSPSMLHQSPVKLSSKLMALKPPRLLLPLSHRPQSASRTSGCPLCPRARLWLSLRKPSPRMTPTFPTLSRRRLDRVLLDQSTLQRLRRQRRALPAIFCVPRALGPRLPSNRWISHINLERSLL